MLKVFMILGHLYTLPPCAVEDANNCYWDAAQMGNHKGSSFVTVNDTVYLWR